MDENNVTQVEETTEVDESTENTETSDTSKEVEEKEETKEEKTFTQEEVNSFLRKERLKWEKKLSKSSNNTSEGKKYEEMTKEEKTNARIKELEDKLADYEHEKVYNDLLKVTQSSLSDSNISTKFASFLVSTDAETTKENVDNFTKVWNKALEKAVNDRIAGKKPSSNNTTKPSTKLTMEDVQKMSLQEVQKNWTEIQKLYQKQ